MTQNLESIQKVTLNFFFFKLSFALFILEVQVIHENVIISFSLKISVLLIHPSSFSFIYNIFIVIKTLTTMNNQFKALNTSKINIYIFISSSHTHINHFSFTLSLISSQNPFFLNHKLIRVTQIHNSWSRMSE